MWLGLRLGLNEPALLCDRFILQRQQKWQRQQQWAAAGGSQVGGHRNVAKTAGARQFGAAYEDASVSARVWCTRHMAKSKSVPTHSSSMRTRDPSALHPTASAFQTGKVRANWPKSVPSQSRSRIKSVGYVLRLTFLGALRLGVNALEVGCVLRDVLATALSQLTSAARVVLAPVACVGAAVVRELLAAARAVLHAAKWSAAAVVERALRPLAEHARAAIATLFEAVLKPLLGAAVLALRTMSRLVEQAAAAMAAAGRHMGAAMAQAYADLAEVMREVYRWLERAGGGKGR